MLNCYLCNEPSNDLGELFGERVCRDEVACMARYDETLRGLRDFNTKAWEYDDDGDDDLSTSDGMLADALGL
jgi:hypothetical protein